ncbi:MAG: undecaprenyl/decaprenyl-phosphate alpha-N-acetylglucosaminyl 1-phosphate transferase [Bacillaceae bacterium]|nr:undecaprenyl/decaprenyl-phosphate alpha-N-acetylglucosaminyl 1-phosphate transferase [Bacillaceae bacterium]
MNLIDGLDGLAAGVSSIALTSILVMAVMDGQWVVVNLSIILIASTTGFLVYNFHPAKIFMGDTGSLFLGYSISVLSMLGLFKNIAIFSFVIPVAILAVPIFDTVFAIIRRLLKRKRLFSPDKSHLHYCLLELGFSHRKSVLIIYGISAFFGLAAIIFSATTMWTGISVVAVFIIILRLFSLCLVNRKQPKKAIQYLLLRLIGQKDG